MDATKRRASAGHTHDPWPCCGQAPASAYGRSKAGICKDCQALIAEGKAARDRLKADLPNVYLWHELDYAIPGYYEQGYSFDSRGDVPRQLQAALFALVSTVSAQAPADTPPDNPAKWTMEPDTWDRSKKRRRNEGWPKVLDAKQGSHDWGCKVVMQQPVRDAINGLDQAIRFALTSAYSEGKRRGRALLAGLASGEISTTKYDATVNEPGDD